MSTDENVSPAVMGRVMKELRVLMRKPLDGITVHVDEADLTTFEAEFDGPVGTPYEKGVFRAQLSLGRDFPHAPPKGTFLTKIFHPNVASNGDICVNTLKRDWKSSHGFAHVLSIIRCLLIHPNPASALNEEAGRLLMESYEEYARRARIFTKIHARKRQSDASSSSSSSRSSRGGELRPSSARSSCRIDRERSPFAERNSSHHRTQNSSRARDLVVSKSSSSLSSSEDSDSDGYSSDEQDENDGYSDDGYSDEENDASAKGAANEDDSDDGYSDDEEEEGEQKPTKAPSSLSSDFSPKKAKSSTSSPSPIDASSSRTKPASTRSASKFSTPIATSAASSKTLVHPRSASPASPASPSECGTASFVAPTTRQLRPKRKKLRL